MIWISCALLAALVVVYVSIIRPKILEFRITAGIVDQLDDYALRGVRRIEVRLHGLKTWLLGVLGVVAAALPQILDALAHHAPMLLEQLRLVDFTAFFSPEVALKVSGGIILAMTVTHVLGLVTAVRIEPKPDDDA